jgi:Domain of unknown function (DUF1841)
MQRYDPLKAPVAHEWLALSEGERTALVLDYHRRKRIRLPNEHVHAVAHMVVENQIAADQPQVQQTVQRLMDEGLDRHQAIHAIGKVLFEYMFDLMKALNAKGDPQSDPNPAYFAALEQLTAESWRRSG